MYVAQRVSRAGINIPSEWALLAQGGAVFTKVGLSERSRLEVISAKNLFENFGIFTAELQYVIL